MGSSFTAASPVLLLSSFRCIGIAGTHNKAYQWKKDIFLFYLPCHTYLNARKNEKLFHYYIISTFPFDWTYSVWDRGKCAWAVVGPASSSVWLRLVLVNVLVWVWMFVVYTWVIQEEIFFFIISRFFHRDNAQNKKYLYHSTNYNPWSCKDIKPQRQQLLFSFLFLLLLPLAKKASEGGWKKGHYGDTENAPFSGFILKPAQHPEIGIFIINCSRNGRTLFVKLWN